MSESKKYLLNDDGSEVKIFIVGDIKKNLINGGGFDGTLTDWRINWTDNGKIKDPLNGKVELETAGFIEQSVPSQSINYNGKAGDTLLISFEATALFGANLQLQIPGTLLDNKSSDTFYTRVDGPHTVAVKLTRDVSKEAPLKVKFSTGNTAQLDNIELYADFEECISQDLIVGGSFDGNLTDWRKNWTDNGKIKDPLNGKVELEVSGLIEQSVPAKSINYNGKAGDTLLISFEATALFGANLQLQIPGTLLNKSSDTFYTRVDGTHPVAVELTRDVSKEAPLKVTFSTHHTAQLDNIKLTTCVTG